MNAVETSIILQQPLDVVEFDLRTGRIGETAARDFPKLKILLMTGFAAQRERASGLNAIVHDVVTKPFSVHDIRTAVADALAAGKNG